ncbi:hypothetical protein SAMN05216419_10053 [Nitrosomonas cryotolerans]|uniref:Uncharacterized protein n=1 Tax=Nitrosomonas cryotolerans ATCC 49181 TaxID=1131553 RepID=A0A1N6G9D5_9PROT|nr:hypothetical protein SAMN05216419_10053 [Nitrosomonas cryotolerans]SIO04169.1 hypothetical protein SAMN02743940_0611 [Nitrosomonas cryotolerans ATCC 49181]
MNKLLRSYLGIKKRGSERYLFANKLLEPSEMRSIFRNHLIQMYI